MINAIILLFTIFLYTGLGTYVLTKNPRDRTNQVFVLFMLAFIIWAVGTYNIGLVGDDVPPAETLQYVKIQLTGLVLALTFFVFLAFFLTAKGNEIKNPVPYLLIIPTAYVLAIIWTSELSGMEPGLLSVLSGSKKEFYLVSAVFGITGIYLLLRHYMSSKYVEREQIGLIITGVLLAIFTAITGDIILPMFFNVYISSLSILAPAVMGVFFAYAIYRFGLFIPPRPEFSETSFCGVECTLCPEYINSNCKGCKFDSEVYKKCEVYHCVVEKGYRDCWECPELLVCEKRKNNKCFRLVSKTGNLLEGGCTFPGVDTGFGIFLDTVKRQHPGLVVTFIPPGKIRKEHCISTTPVVWITDDAYERGVKPDDLKKLQEIIMNFMNRAEKPVVLLEGIDRLIEVNGLDKVLSVIRALCKTGKDTQACFMILTEPDSKYLERLSRDLECTGIGTE